MKGFGDSIKVIIANVVIQVLFSARTVIANFDSVNEISFRAYTDLNNPNKFFTIQSGNLASLRASNLNVQEKVTIIAHVFLEDILISKSPSQQLKNAYHEAGQSNIIIAHWKRKSSKPISVPQALLLYTSVALNDAPQVSPIIAKFVAFLLQNGVPPENIHLIGLSLGAHISGSAGHHLQKTNSVKIGRVTGLDPPGALFYFISNDKKLDPSDATFVDVLHTDIVLLGTKERQGQLDVYSNGGKRESQPGCNAGVIFPTYLDWVFCGHTSSVTIFAESLKKDFPICKCADSGFAVCGEPRAGVCSLPTTFGEHGSLTATGSYYLKV